MEWVADKVEVVEVEWEDSASMRSWQDEETIERYGEPMMIHSIGFLQRETDTFINITSSLADNGDVNSPMSIPKSAIRNIWTITIPKGRHRGED